MSAENSLEILLVEDNFSDAELAIRALKRNSFAQNLLHVQDGEEALDFLFSRGQYAARALRMFPKVVLLDLKLPRVTGLEVLRALKTNPRTQVIPVVMLTSSREERDIAEAYEFGANSYLVKPVDFENFARAMASLGQYWLHLNQPPAECTRPGASPA